jgi:hypothetical protein
MKKRLFVVAAVFLLSFLLPNLQAGTLAINQFDVSLFDGSSQLTSGQYAVFFGSFSGGVFTPFLGPNFTPDNQGYIDLDEDPTEFQAGLSQNDNSILTAGTPIFLAISIQQPATAFNPNANIAVITDPAWSIPVFGPFSFDVIDMSSNTFAAYGSFNFNSGEPIITAVPEPSSAALLLFGAAAFCMLRNRRKA